VPIATPRARPWAILGRQFQCAFRRAGLGRISPENQSEHIVRRNGAGRMGSSAEPFAALEVVAPAADKPSMGNQGRAVTVPLSQ